MSKRNLIAPRDWTVLGPLVDELCDVAEGSSVTICHDTPDFGGYACCVYVSNPGTDWVEKAYRANTVEACLKEALSEYGMWEIAGTVVPSFMENSLI